MKVKVVIPNSAEIAKKGNGRIFVQSEEDKKKVLDIIKEIDEYEFENYLPTDFVAVFNKEGNNKLIHTHKFDIQIPEFTMRCQKEDIYVLVYSCNQYNYDDMLTLERAVQNDLGVGLMSDFVYNKTKDW